MMVTGLKQRAARYGALASRWLLRWSPWAARRVIWESVVQRHLLWRNLRFEARTRFGAQMSLHLGDSIQSKIFFFGVWEPVITDYIGAALRPGDVFVDVGANIGYYSLLAAQRVGPGGQVFAIEASPAIHARLVRNLADNGAANVRAINAAVCEMASSVPIYLNKDGNLGGSTILADATAGQIASLEAYVPGDTLDQLVPETALRAARLIKIDVEGAEWLVVRGMGTMLPRLSDRTEIIVEVNAEALAWHGTTPQAFFALFAAAGFHPFVIENEYTVGHYIRPPAKRPLASFLETKFTQVDLVFRRQAAGH